GSENTNKRLVSGSLVPGGSATFEISYPVTADDVSGRTTFVITDCVFIDGNAALKYSVSFVPNTENFILTFTLQIPAGTPIGAEYCNYAKTTAAPSKSPASNRKAGPACFVVGGNISVLKTNEAGDPLSGAQFHVVCTLPTTTAFLPTTIINGQSFESHSGDVIDTTATTGSNGLVVIQAPEGTSCVITETVPPDGYTLPAHPSVTLVASSGGVSHTFVDTLPNPSLSIVKDATETSYNAVGDIIHYSITATNNGDVVLHNVTVTDPKATGLDCTPAIPVANLAVGATITCTATHVVTQADIDAGHYLNTACVNDGAGGAAEACDDADVNADQNPHLSIVKDATESSYSAVGDVINYTITATNDGNVTLHNVTITDPKATGLSCTPAIPVTNLAVGGTIECTASHTVTQADIDAGHYLNTACVDDGAGGAAQACDDADVNGNQTPHLSIVKDATESSYSAVGDVIHYTITATNDGNTTLASVTVTDANATSLSCTPANGSPLAPGASMDCTATHTVTQADIDAGHYLNTACVDDGAGGAAQACDDADVNADQNPHLSIVKDATESSYDSVGDVIHYQITATNDGNVTLHNVTVTDANATNLSCTPAIPVANLAVGGTIVCTANHTVTQADIDAGHYLNTACVDATGATQACDDADVNADQNPSLSIVKDATESTYDSVGDVIHYTITATNTGNTTIAAATVTDANADNLTCTPANGSPLAPAATMTCTADHTVTQADIDAGHYLNTACVDDGVGEGGAAQACDDANVPATSNRGLSIVKDATETSYSAVGDILHYTIVATNTGNTTLDSVTVTDVNATGLSCTPANGSSLAPAATMTCTATHTVTQADIDAGHYLNTACVSATDATATCDDADVNGGQTPHLSIVKDATESSYSAVGDVIHYSITATNDGNTTLASVTVTDVNATGLDCTPANGSSLAPAATMTCTATHTITAADIAAGTYRNTACVDATGATKACDFADVVGATLTISKTNNAPIQTLDLPNGGTADLPTADEGATVTFTLTYTLGEVSVTNGTIKDVLPAGLTYVVGSATSSTEFTFDGYDTATRTLSWSAESVTTNGTLTYQAKVDVGANLLAQPLENVATIKSDQTASDQDSSDVFVPAPPLAETFKPTPPPTDALGPTEPSNPGISLMLLLAVLGVLIAGIAFVTPVPAAVRRRNRR
ncbi:MAG TPA: hypothetical protein VIL81_01835, partial [Candidatus Limnocylindrales bacterium]